MTTSFPRGVLSVQNIITKVFGLNSSRLNSELTKNPLCETIKVDFEGKRIPPDRTGLIYNNYNVASNVNNYANTVM